MYVDKENNLKYIGQSINISKRKKEHRNSNCTYFDRILSQKGESNFDFIILEECSKEELDEKERYWIAYYDSYNNGYNQTPGGHPFGEQSYSTKITEEQALSIIELLKNTKLSHSEIADKIKCSVSTVTSINNCRAWSYLHKYEEHIRQECGQSDKTGTSKLTVMQAQEIIKLLETTEKTQIEIAELFNVSRRVIGKINNCQMFSSLHKYKNNIRQECNNYIEGKRKITKQQALEIIDQLINTNKSMVNISKEMNIPVSTIYTINLCDSWKQLHPYKKNIRKECKLTNK